MSIESSVLRRIKPNEDEISRIQRSAERLRALASDYALRNGIEAEIKLVGSVAKGTFLSDPDLDLLMMFPEGVPRSEVNRIGLLAGEDLLHGQRLFSEHPYTRGVFEGMDVDLVPCYRLRTTERLQTAVDRTPFHTDFVRSRMDDDMRDEVRLLKKFMKGIEAYGAEPNTRGFSGYACELLVIHYGGFRKVLEAAAGWKEGMTIAIDGKGPAMIGPIVMYDPVDPKRNVTSAVHIDTFATLITAAKAYLREPDERFFFPNEREPMEQGGLSRLAEIHGSRLITVIFDRPDIIEDNLCSQLWKTRYALAKKLNEYSFNVLRAVHRMNPEELVIVFELERDVLSKTYKHHGPPVWVRTSEAFLEKWRDNEFGEPFIEDGNWNVIAERFYSTAAEMISDEISMSGIGREIDPRTMSIRNHGETLCLTDRRLLTELLDPRHSWVI